jgi:hypothetical protein
VTLIVRRVAGKILTSVTTFRVILMNQLDAEDIRTQGEALQTIRDLPVEELAVY